MNDGYMAKLHSIIEYIFVSVEQLKKGRDENGWRLEALDSKEFPPIAVEALKENRDDLVTYYEIEVELHRDTGVGGSHGHSDSDFEKCLCTKHLERARNTTHSAERAIPVRVWIVDPPELQRLNKDDV